MDKPLVSIIIPVHNRFVWLEKAIQSVINQTYSNFELIIVDDYSFPPVSEKLGIDDRRIRIIRSNENQGPGVSRELGRLNSKGEFINFLDSDDYFHPEKIEKQIEFLQNEPEINMCYCTSVIFENEPFSEPEIIYSLSDKHFETIIPIILFQRPWPTSSWLWRREFTKKIGGWSSLWVGEDIEYEIRAACFESKIGFLPEKLTFIRVNNEHEQLSKYSKQRRITGTDYKLRIAQNLKKSSYCSNSQVRIKIFEIILNQLIFLLSKNEIVLAKRCLIELYSFKESSTSNTFFFIILKLVFFFPQQKLGILLLRKLRKIIFQKKFDQINGNLSIYESSYSH